jgi:tRNA pseudouridine38-40 synthase
LADSKTLPFSTNALPTGQRIALRIEYLGTGFSGWQAQTQLPQLQTVQTEVERALGKVANCSIRVHCAGRTDTGVHGIAQWVHFDAPAARSLKAWVVGGNAQLPASVRLADVRAVPEDFHARHSATARQYDYLISNTPTASALLADRALWVRQPLDAPRMHAALQALLGECDFSAFRAAACQSTTPMRYLESASVRRYGSLLRLRVTANAFLHHMVRNIVGSALQVGLGLEAEGWLGLLLEGRDRTVAAATAPSHGLYLSGVRYPERFAIPPAPALPYFPADTQD